MKLISFTVNGHEPLLGILEKETVRELNGLLTALAKHRSWQIPQIFNLSDLLANPLFSSYETLNAANELATGQSNVYPLTQVKLLAPFAKGSKMIAIGRNYAAHAKELGNEAPTEPIYFAKLASTVIAPEEPIVMPPESKRVDHEGELAVVVGKRLRRPQSESEAIGAVFGYTIANDVTARDLQKAAGAKGQPWTRAKNYDTFCPLGPAIITADSFSPEAVNVRCTVNGVIKQDGNTSDFIFPVGKLLHFVSQNVTLEPGDILLTGTPEGVSPLNEGDSVTVSIDGIGELSNPVSGSRL